MSAPIQVDTPLMVKLGPPNRGSRLASNFLPVDVIANFIISIPFIFDFLEDADNSYLILCIFLDAVGFI